MEGLSSYAAHRAPSHYQSHPSNNLIYNLSIIASCVTLSETNLFAKGIRTSVTNSIDDKFPPFI